MNQENPSKFNRRATDRPEGKLRIAAMGDLHIHENPAAPYREVFAKISQEADILLLCGDLTNLGLPAEAENLAKDLSSLAIPCLGVLGNHDHHSGQPAEIKKILAEAGMHLLEEETFELNDVGFAGVKGFGGGFENHMLGAFGEQALKNFVTEAVNEALKLENALRSLDSEKLIVATHYSPITATVTGEPPEIFPFLGSSRLAETVDRFDKVRAVFHGHAHHGAPQGKTLKGIPVFNCAQDVLKKAQPDKSYVIFEV